MKTRSKSILFAGLLLAGEPSCAWDIYVAPDGADSNEGSSMEAPLASMGAAHKRLLELEKEYRVSEPSTVWVAPGNYYCRGMGRGRRSNWTYYSPSGEVSIQPLAQIAAPASKSENDALRPTFYGVDENGKPCRESVWMTVRHGKVRMGLAIRGLKIKHYRGALSIAGWKKEITRVDQEITITNMVFEEIGDLYWKADIAGKGAILLDYTFGNLIEGNVFRRIQNDRIVIKEEIQGKIQEKIQITSGLIHGIYFAHAASRNRVVGNRFAEASGSAIKLTDYSNLNRFEHNHFNNVQQVINDRWCGARNQPEDQP